MRPVVRLFFSSFFGKTETRGEHPPSRKDGVEVGRLVLEKW